ncbi:MAG: bifunctional phosphopantothenoylcysteine decarboxylase/phosphopantothenate--cysteine ligase CoaBC [bacterium]
MNLKAKKIALGITGSIAAYKACAVVRELKRAGHEVRVAMTASAQKFVSALTFATLSENPVMNALFEETEKVGVVHIDLARWCDAFLVCPATANILSKVANGVADEMVSTTIMATKSPVIFCPAMNTAMWENALVQENVEKLLKHGYEFVDPEWGEMATQAEGEGAGRLAETSHILQKLKYILFASKELDGKKVLVTAGATREAIDPVRFISNHSSGKMGFALAEAAKLKGAEVVLVAGATQLPKPYGIKYRQVTTVDEMKQAVEEEYQNTDILIMAAAVSDYKPATISNHKIKKSDSKFQLHFQKTPDVLADLGKQKLNRIHVGFALETENSVANATKKLHAKNLDLIVLNNPLEPGAAFASDTNIVTTIDREGTVEKKPKMPKSEVAEIIMDKVCHLYDKKYRSAAIA